MLVIPPRKSSRAVELERKGEYVCPLCQASRTREAGPVEWVDIHAGTRSVTVCLGCCIDIFATCGLEDCKNDPYWDIVTDAARHFGISVDLFRRECIKIQIAILKSNPDEGRGTRWDAFLKRLESLAATMTPDKV